MNQDILDKPSLKKEEIQYKNSALKFGLIAGLISILLSLILYFTNLQFESWTKWLSSFLTFILIILGIKSIATENKGSILTFGTLFKAGLIITIILTIVSIVYFIIFTTVIDTDFTNKLIDVQREVLKEKGLSEEQIDRSMRMVEKMMSPIMMSVVSFFTFLTIGTITSLIGAAIFKKEPNNISY